jgi:hypothetical protein
MIRAVIVRVVAELLRLRGDCAAPEMFAIGLIST